MTDLHFKPVDKSNWPDLEKLFESKGGPHNCWCMVWRKMLEGTSRYNKADTKQSLISYITNQTPVGLLCYDGEEAIAWCSVAPGETYRDLAGDNTLLDVWSLVCLFIKRKSRQKGIAKELIFYC